MPGSEKISPALTPSSTAPTVLRSKRQFFGLRYAMTLVHHLADHRLKIGRSCPPAFYPAKGRNTASCNIAIDSGACGNGKAATGAEPDFPKPHRWYFYRQLWVELGG